MLIPQLFRSSLLGAEVGVAIPTIYLSVLTTAAILETAKRKKRANLSSPSIEVAEFDFAILIPAHNEEVLLPGLLASLAAVDYPKDKYSIYIVADNCTDTTAQLARKVGWVHVFERFDQEKRGKGYALNWLWQKLHEERSIHHDAYVIVDADSIVDSKFLQAMARELAKGSHAMQADSTVLNATDSPGTVLRLIAISLFYHIRALGRNALGASSTLNGNGMCFSRSLLERYPWQAYSLSEDYQYYINLVKHGELVRYVPDAVVSSYMPASFKQMRTQDIRWESSGSDTVWRITGELLQAGFRLRKFVCFEAVMELLTPPLSLLASCVFMLLLASLFLWSLPALIIALLLLAGLIYYVGTGIYFLHFPRTIYKTMLYVPGFMLWKLWVILVLSKSKKYTNQWIRSSRPLP
jgi:cellulose synthase/poly-beta-1,6-N-acetylglucosamine synthase-like glycosyltransferase